MQTILIVDDEPHVVLVIKRFLHRFGYNIVSASNGEQALKLLETEKPDVLLTDIQMPRMNGQELVTTVQKQNPAEQPMIIVMTSRTDEELRTWAEMYPNTMFLEKPLSLRHLSNILEKYFTERQAV